MTVFWMFMGICFPLLLFALIGVTVWSTNQEAKEKAKKGKFLRCIICLRLPDNPIRCVQCDPFVHPEYLVFPMDD